MAVLAITGYPDMLAGHRTGLDAAGIRMALGALPGRAGEDSLLVTGFALDRGMPEVERKSGFVVIEIGAEVDRRNIRRNQPGEQ